MFCDFNIMSIEWQMIFDFTQKQMNDLRYFLDHTINIAIEITFVEQTRIFERTINEIINVCFNFLFAHFAFFLSTSWNSISNEQKQFAIESISVLKRLVLSINLNHSESIATSVSSFATISSSSFMIFRHVIFSSFRFEFRSTLKFAFIARLVAYDCFLFFRWFQSLIFFWRATFLYRCLMKKEFD